MRIVDKMRMRALRWLTKGKGVQDFWHALMPSWRTGVPAAWADDPTEQIKHYKHWVYAAVSTIAFRVASVRMALYKRLSAGEVEEVIEHPLLNLFEFVNPFHTRFWLWAETLTFLELTGNAYWYVPKNGLGIPGEIWLIHSQHMKVVPDQREFIRGYEYRQGMEKIDFEPSEIIHLKYPNPTNVYYGRGPLQAAAGSVDAHDARSTAHYQTMKRGFFVGPAFSTDQPLNDEQIERLRTQVEQKYSTPEKAGRPLLLEGGLKASRIDLAPNEMAFLESSQITRAEILGIFRVPEAIAGLSENVNKAVAAAMDTIFARYCIAPKLRLIEDQLNQDLLPRYDPKLFVRFEDVIPEDHDQKRADMDMNLKHGVTTINEERQAQGLDPVDWGGRPLMPMTLIPLTGKEPEKPEPEEPEEEAEPEKMMVKALTPEKRTQIREWFKKAYIRDQTILERKMVRGAERFFRGQERRVMGALARELKASKGWLSKAANGKVDALVKKIFKNKAEAGQMQAALMPYIQTTLVKGGERTISSVGANIAFDLKSPEAQKWLKQKGPEYWQSAKAPNHATIEKIHKRLAVGMAEGATPTELTKSVRAVFGEAKTSRARTIARTETVGAFNGGGEVVRNDLAGKGIRTIKTWFTTMDDATRPDHADMNGVSVDHGKPFMVGGADMDYPGDPSGPVEQTVNCRCGHGTEVKEGK